MPYIPSKRRKALNEHAKAKDVGELTYVICKAVDDYLRSKGRAEGLRYQYLAEAAGALANAQMEVYRRVTAPYEITKIQEHTDMFHSQKLIKERIINE